MVGWHHQLDGHEFKQAPGTVDGQRSLACWNLWGCKESDMTEWLNWTEVLQGYHFLPCVLVYMSSCVYPTRVEFLIATLVVCQQIVFNCYQWHVLYSNHLFSSIQSLSHVWLFPTPWTAARQASLSIINSWSLLKLMSIESVMPSNHLIFCHPLLLPPSIFPSIRVFSNELVLCIRWPKYWSFSFSISPSNEHPGLISFRMDWFDFAVQGLLKSLLQHCSSKASVLQCSTFL